MYYQKDYYSFIIIWLLDLLSNHVFVYFCIYIFIWRYHYDVHVQNVHVTTYYFMSKHILQADKYLEEFLKVSLKHYLTQNYFWALPQIEIFSLYYINILSLLLTKTLNYF
jgi:hypothetical protein